MSSDRWDIALGSALVSDYNYRGITLSAHKVSMMAHMEPRFRANANLEFYSGLAVAGIDSPNRAGAQMSYYGGVRPSFGALSFDLGIEYIVHPGGRLYDGLGSALTCTNGAFFFGQCNTSKAVESYWEFYFRPNFTISKTFQIGGSLNYSPSWANTGAPETYASLIVKFALPPTILPAGVGASVSSEIGHQWFGITDSFFGAPDFPNGTKLPDYTTWNIGLTLTHKSLSLDLRYYDTNLSKANCNVLTSDHTAIFGGFGAVTPINPAGLISNWCSAAFVAKISFDTTLRNLPPKAAVWNPRR